MKRKNKINGIKEIALFIMAVLVVSIVSFSDGVSAVVSKSPDNLVVINMMQQGQKCNIEVGEEEKLTQLYQGEVEKSGNGLVNSFDNVKDKTKDIHLAMNPGFNGIDKATEEAIKKECGKDAFNLAKSISNKPDSFGGQINFEKGELKEFKNFQFKKLDKSLNIDGFGELSGNGNLDSKSRMTPWVEGKIHELKLEDDGNFVLDKKYQEIVDKKIHKLGTGSWELDLNNNKFIRVNSDNGGLVDIKGDGTSELVKFRKFDATIKNDGSYTNMLRAEADISDKMPSGKRPYQTIALNGDKYADLTKHSDLTAGFDDKGVMTSMDIKAEKGQVTGFGFLDKNNNIDIKGVSIEQNGKAIIKPVPTQKGGIDSYKFYSGEGKERVFYQYDEKLDNIQHILPNNREDNALLVGKERNIMSNKIDQRFLVDGQEVTIARRSTKSMTPWVESPVYESLANDPIELVSSSGNINTKSGSAIQFFEKDGKVGIITRKIQEADIVSNGQNLGSLHNYELLAPRSSQAGPSLQEVKNIDPANKLSGYISNGAGGWTDISKTLNKQGLGKDKLFGGGSGVTSGKENNGLTWLLVIGGVGAVAAYAFSKSGDKDKDKKK